MKRVLALALMAVLIPSTLLAVVPDPGLSTTPACIRVFPNGSLNLNGQVIGNNGLPLGNNQVRLIFAAACTGLRICPVSPPTQPTVITVTSNATGNFTFTPKVGGCCSATISASIEADPGAVTLRVYNAVGSADNTGDLSVTLGDFVNFQAAFNTAQSCNDIDGSCNGNVTLGDFVVFQALFNTTCTP